MSNNHLIIGLGGTGGRIIRAFRRTIFQEHRNVEPCQWDEKTSKWLPPVARIGYLYVDSNGADLEGNDDAWKVLGQSVKLDPDSLLQVSDADVQSVFSNSVRNPGISPWIGDHETLRPMIANAGGAQGAQQIRRFGRFLFATKVNDFTRHINNAVNRLTTGSTSEVVFHVCCTLAAGTGSGSIVDAITQIRKQYPDRKAYPIYLYSLVTDKNVEANTGNFYANQYAALTEINALILGNFKPHDLAAVSPNRLSLRDNFQQCYLLTGENEQHDTATREEQEQIIADYLYQKIVALKGNIPDKIAKAESFEDVSQYPAENNERSYRFGSFGIKRFAIPEQEIREKLAFTFAQQAGLQFQFNNWSDNGFLKTARNRDLPELVTRAANNERWFLTLDHLKLSTDFRLAGGTSWPKLSDDWDVDLENEKLDIMETNPQSKEKWLTLLRDYANTKYCSIFRERGVVQYYEDKRLAKADYAREIRGKVEADLFDRWKTGEDSIMDTQRIIGALIEYLAGEKQKIDQLIANERKFVEEGEENAVGNEREWAKIGWLSDKITGKSKKVFEAYTLALKEKYVAQTEAIALEFAKELIQQVLAEVTELGNQVDVVAGRITKASEQFEKNVAARCAREEQVNYRAKLVRLVEPDVIDRTIARLATDRKVQEAQALAARTRICSELGADQSFTSFAKSVSDIALVDLLSNACDEAAEVAHENLFKQPTDFRRIMGVNIIEKLNEQYGGLTEQLQQNIRTLVQSAAAYMTFDGQQTQPAVLLRDPQMPQMPKGSITVFLPRCANLEQSFRRELKLTFERSIGGGQVVEVVDTDHNPNEITVVSVRYWFGLRFMKPLLRLREHYEAKLRSGEAGALHQIHLENQRCEVDGLPFGRGITQLANLFLLDDDAIRRKSLPVLLLAKAFKMMETLKNPDTGQEGLYFIAERTSAGRALTPPVELESLSLTELVEKITPDKFEVIEASVRQRLQSEENRHIDKKAELKAELDDILNSVYAERGQNELDKVYKRFMTAVDDAAKLIG